MKEAVKKAVLISPKNLFYHNWSITDCEKGTVEFRRLDQCFIDWARATALVGEADGELTCVTLTYNSSGPIYETSAQSTKSPGIRNVRNCHKRARPRYCCVQSK